MDFLYDYLAFLARVLTVLVAVVLAIAFAAAQGSRRPRSHQGYLEVTLLNDRYRSMREALLALIDPALNKRDQKRLDKEDKQRSKKGADPQRRRVFVVDFVGDLQASQGASLANVVSAVLTTAADGDEVVVRLESAGGVVHGYGFAAAQLQRVKRKGVRLTVAVDKVAASGGYMMAVVADRVLAGPFALVGSIGVVAQVPNVHRLLQRIDVDFDVITAGEHKRTMTVFGENTDQGREKFTEELEDVHALFQEFVKENRPVLDMAEVATGEAWYGQRALQRQLVDELVTSEDYLMTASLDADVYEVKWVEHRRAVDRLMERFTQALNRIATRVADLLGRRS